MNKEYTIRDLYEIYCEAMPRYPLAYERFRDILHKDNSQIFTAERHFVPDNDPIPFER